jgi:hypothetical protein
MKLEEYKMVKEKKVKVVKVKAVKVPKEKKVRVPRESKGSTPQEMIDAMNLSHQDWKTTPQVKYDKDGMRLN